MVTFKEFSRLLSETDVMSDNAMSNVLGGHANNSTTNPKIGNDKPEGTNQNLEVTRKKTEHPIKRNKRRLFK